MPILGVIASSYPQSNPAAWDSIASATPNGVSTFDFTSIPATYKHLKILSIHRTSVGTAVDNVQMTFNNDTSSNYQFTYGYAGNTTIGAGNTIAGSAFYMRSTGSLTTYFAAAIVDIYDYSNSSKWTTVHSNGAVAQNSADSEVWFMNSTWFNTTTVNKITIGYGAGGFTSGSEFHLYGIKG
jgi:hypothetical protein